MNVDAEAMMYGINSLRYLKSIAIDGDSPERMNYNIHLK